MIGAPRVERAMQRLLIPDITIAPVDRKRRRSDVDEDRARAAPLDVVAFARDDDDHLVAKPGACAQLRVDIGPNAPAQWRVEGADVDDPHRSAWSRETDPTSSEAFLM